MTPPLGVCEHCGNRLVAKDRRQRFCSKGHATAYRNHLAPRVDPMTRPCTQCGGARTSAYPKCLGCKRELQRERARARGILAVRDPARVRARFWARVEKTDFCWQWTGCKDRLGYGALRINMKLVRAHRYAYEDRIGPIPTDLVIDHLCRNSSCVNPSHLEPVTHQENLLRGNHPSTNSGGRPKLTLEAARAIRASASTLGELALRFGVHRATIRNIRAGKAWKEAAA